MKLAPYQQEIVKQIYHLLTDDDDNKSIFLHGDVGCGKSTIASGILELLKEGWAIFYLEGLDPNLSPYLTWCIGTEIYDKKKFNFGNGVSFNINFLPIPISINNTVQHNKLNIVLTPSEEALVAAIKEQSASNNNILFIADNYELWDEPSKSFLKKIMFSKLNLFSKFHIVTLFISNKSNIGIPNKVIDVHIGDISDDDITFILNENNIPNCINIKDIRVYTGNDIALIAMYVNYFNEHKSFTYNFSDIMQKRIDNLSSKEKDACAILNPLSIIDSIFCENEAACFIDPAINSQDDVLDLAVDYLNIAEKQKFIIGKNKYRFRNEKIKIYFREQIVEKKKQYHRKFASFLRQQYPEDYFNRGKHLAAGLRKNDFGSILEAWQLFFLSYMRRTCEIGSIEDTYNIFEQIESLLNHLNDNKSNLKERQYETFNEFSKGFYSFLKYEYKDAIKHLECIDLSELNLLCRSECERLLLLSYIQLAENKAKIEQLANSLYNTIHEKDFCEDEQYCQIALILLEVYIDRSNDIQKVDILQRKFLKIVNRHTNNISFVELDRRYDRKAALFYTAKVACKRTKESIKFYYEYHNYIELYMALCNHLGNNIVDGDYDTATKTLEAYDKIFNQTSTQDYPSQYKIENNRLLLNYLKHEKEISKNQEYYLDNAKEAAKNFFNLMQKQNDENSYVIYFNYLGLSLLSGSETIDNDIKELKIKLSYAEGYYKFFLHDLLFAYSLLQGDITSAKEELNILKTLNVPLLQQHQYILKKRQEEQERLIDCYEQLDRDPWNYHNAIASCCTHIQDSSCLFYGRGFLLSDLQFLSF